jgi:molecular chaperone HtpG
VCVSKEDLELEEVKEENKTREAEAAEFADAVHHCQGYSGDKVEKVIVSNRISDSPVSSSLVNLAGHPTW